MQAGARTGEQRGVGDVVRLHAGRAHAAKHLLRRVGAPARAARRHERRVGDHVGRAPRVAGCRRLHLAKHLRAARAHCQGVPSLAALASLPGMKPLLGCHSMKEAPLQPQHRLQQVQAARGQRISDVHVNMARALAQEV